jgi:hypothetical protein
MVVTAHHRVDRVPAFSPVVRVGTPPPRHPQASMPPPLWLTGERSTLAGGRGSGGAQFQ